MPIVCGSCKNPIEFVIDETLLARANPRDIKQDTWINFWYINNLSISGSGTIEGQGKYFWPLNDCHKNTNFPKLAMTMGFAFVNNSRIKDITSLNSKMGHFNFFSVHPFNITGVTITAPVIAKILTVSKWVLVATFTSQTHTSCGSVHGISVESLGKNKDEKDVKHLTVRDTVFNGTSDGIRIKTWESSASIIVVTNFIYENIQMIDVGKPINIDQKYCPHPPYDLCFLVQGESHVQIQDIKLKNIYGTSKNIVAVNLQCSKSFPCKNVELIDINLKHTGLEKGHPKAMCENVDGSVRGRMVSQHCLD
ncbi:putative galacturan 1,4-alpha-galacturonidase [Arabidopsis thaliana]